MSIRISKTGADMSPKKFYRENTCPYIVQGDINIFVMDEQKKRAQEIWETNIDGETYIYDPNEIADKLEQIDTRGTVL